jgi:4-aminobutyrate aminotransferase/(S)-3-amino-2-methylpropionate transaminase
MWAHEYWELDTPPDFVTFSKKMQAAGFYHRPADRAPAPYQNFNTWIGDPMRALQMGVIVEEIRRHDLLRTVRESGEALMAGLRRMERAHAGKIANVRGLGTLIAFDFPSAALRDAFASTMRNGGVQISGCGERSIRLRPMLIFTPTHADLLLRHIDATLAKQP